MNLILLEPTDFTDARRVRLDGRRFEHARDVLGVAPGQELQVGLLGGRMGTGTVCAISGSDLELDVRLESPPPPPLPATLIIALPRPKVLKRVLQGVTALGIKRIVLVNSWRVDKSYWLSPALETDAITEQLRLGLEQGRDTILPEVVMHKRFKPFAEDILPGLLDGTAAFVAHPVASQPCPANLDRPLALAIGPEGGFTDYEVGMLAAAGMTPVHLGQRPLRVETAVPALLGRLLACS